MTNEEFLRDVCPNHTEKSQWNRSEILRILEKHKEVINCSHSVDVISFNEWKKRYVVKYNENEYIVRNVILNENDLIFAYNKDVELFNTLIDNSKA